jgi:hypothetical protein
VLLRWSLVYKRTLETSGPSPSQGAKSTGYHAIQSDNAQVIYDGRWACDGIGSTIGPPIQLFHPIFNEFFNLVNAPDTKPTTKDLKNVYELMDYVSEVGWKNGYSEGLQARLTNILGFMIHEETNPDGFRTDNAITLQIGTTRIMTLIMEVKRELGEGCDPSTQVSLSMRRSWIDSQVGYTHIHLDLMSDSSIEKCHSRKVLLPNILDRCRGTMAQYSGWHIHRQGYCPTPD